MGQIVSYAVGRAAAASRMHALASAIEEKGRNGSLDGAEATFLQLRAECARVREALEAAR